MINPLKLFLSTFFVIGFVQVSMAEPSENGDLLIKVPPRHEKPGGRKVTDQVPGEFVFYQEMQLCFDKYKFQLEGLTLTNDPGIVLRLPKRHYDDAIGIPSSSGTGATGGNNYDENVKKLVKEIDPRRHEYSKRLESCLLRAAEKLSYDSRKETVKCSCKKENEAK